MRPTRSLGVLCSRLRPLCEPQSLELSDLNVDAALRCKRDLAALEHAPSRCARHAARTEDDPRSVAKLAADTAQDQA
jgi:hypothetical protein